MGEVEHMWEEIKCWVGERWPELTFCIIIKEIGNLFSENRSCATLSWNKNGIIWCADMDSHPAPSSLPIKSLPFIVQFKCLPQRQNAHWWNEWIKLFISFLWGKNILMLCRICINTDPYIIILNLKLSLKLYFLYLGFHFMQPIIMKLSPAACPRVAGFE